MDDRPFVGNGFGYALSRRRSFLLNAKPTATERWRIQDLIESVNHALNRMETDAAQTTPEKNRRKPAGSREKLVTSSLETLLFWVRMLERDYSDYASKVPVETEFRVRVRLLRRRVRASLYRNNE